MKISSLGKGGNMRCNGIVSSHSFNKKNGVTSLMLEVLFTLESETCDSINSHEQYYSFFLRERVFIEVKNIEKLLKRRGYKNSWWGRFKLLSFLKSRINNLSRDLQDNLNNNISMYTLLSIYPRKCENSLINLVDNTQTNGERYLDLFYLEKVIEDVVMYIE